MAAGRIGSVGNMPQTPNVNPPTLGKGEAAELANVAAGTGRKVAGAAGAAMAALGNVEGESEAAAVAGGKDFGVQLSEGGRRRADAHRKALNIARGTPDVREDKVADIKKRIAEGSYQVDSGKVADGIMHEAIRDHLAQTPD